MAISERRARLIWSLEREKAASDENLAQKKAVADQLLTLLGEWLQTSPSKKVESGVHRAVDRLINEIYSGKTANIAERFQQAVERATAAALSRRKVTYLQTLDALQRLLQVNRQWHKAATRSKAEQDRALHTLRIMLREVEAGHTEDLDARFQRAIVIEEQPHDNQAQ